MHHVIGALAIGAIGGRAAGNSEKRRRIVSRTDYGRHYRQAQHGSSGLHGRRREEN
jgi:hypothetical protein